MECEGQGGGTAMTGGFTGAVSMHTPRSPQDAPTAARARRKYHARSGVCKLPTSLMGRSPRTCCETKQAAPDPLHLPLFSSFAKSSVSWSSRNESSTPSANIPLSDLRPCDIRKQMHNFVTPTRDTGMSNKEDQSKPGPGAYTISGSFEVASRSDLRCNIFNSTRGKHVSSCKGTLALSSRLGASCETLSGGPGMYNPQKVTMYPTSHRSKRLDGFPPGTLDRSAWIRSGLGATQLAPHAYCSNCVSWSRPSFNKMLRQQQLAAFGASKSG
ncbi:hypothetical protein DIPPA_06164 [Diplonema papillatum]|nr:hypothetical protein DIPPA_06164 [Diplonema papillatum]